MDAEHDDLQDLIDFHLAEAAHSRHAAATTCADNPQHVRTGLLARAAMHEAMAARVYNLAQMVKKSRGRDVLLRNVDLTGCIRMGTPHVCQNGLTLADFPTWPDGVPEVSGRA